jgi:hypothetical protein
MKSKIKHTKWDIDFMKIKKMHIHTHTDTYTVVRDHKYKPRSFKTLSRQLNNHQW